MLSCTNFSYVCLFESDDGSTSIRMRKFLRHTQLNRPGYLSLTVRTIQTQPALIWIHPPHLINIPLKSAPSRSWIGLSSCSMPVSVVYKELQQNNTRMRSKQITHVSFECNSSSAMPNDSAPLDVFEARMHKSPVNAHGATDDQMCRFEQGLVFRNVKKRCQTTEDNSLVVRVGWLSGPATDKTFIVN